MNTYHLVSCVSKKLDHPAPAKDLYCSTWFKLARKYVEAQQTPWFILSAEHWLVRPDQVLEPYNKRMGGPKWARRAWAWNVDVALLSAGVRPGDRIVILAGYDYREFLVPDLEARNMVVEAPLHGFDLFQQLKWFKEYTT